MTLQTHARLAAVAAAGFLAITSAGFAHADTVTSGNGSILGGNQTVLDGDVPVNVTGNAVGAVLGVAGASSTDSDAVVAGNGGGDVATSGNGSIGGGNQLVSDVDLPVNVCGNAIAVAGIAGAQCVDGDAVIEDDPGKPEHPGYPGYPEEPEHPEEPEPEHPGYPEEPDHPDHPDHPEEPPAEEKPPTATPELPRTGAGLTGLVASAFAAAATGAGLLFAGRRRRV